MTVSSASNQHKAVGTLFLQRLEGCEDYLAGAGPVRKDEARVNFLAVPMWHYFRRSGLLNFKGFHRLSRRCKKLRNLFSTDAICGVALHYALVEKPPHVPSPWVARRSAVEGILP